MHIFFYHYITYMFYHVLYIYILEMRNSSHVNHRSTLSFPIRWENKKEKPPRPFPPVNHLLRDVAKLVHEGLGRHGKWRKQKTAEKNRWNLMHGEGGEMCLWGNYFEETSFNSRYLVWIKIMNYRRSHPTKISNMWYSSILTTMIQPWQWINHDDNQTSGTHPIVIDFDRDCSIVESRMLASKMS